MGARAAVVVVALLAAACSGGDGGAGGDAGDAGDAAGGAVAGDRAREAASAGGTLRLGIERLGSLDPATATPDAPSTAIAADLLFDGLDELAEPGQTPDGGRTWRFTLRPDARFGDGSPVTSLDVAASLERVPGRPAGLAVTVHDAATFDVVLARPLSSFPDLLATPAYGIAPAAAVAADDFLRAATSGSGPFRLVGADGDVLRLVRSPGADALVDAVELHQFDALAGAYDAFDAGALDWTLLSSDRAEVAAERHGTDGFVPSATALLLAFDRADPAFADVRVRRAVAVAVDRKAVARALYLGVADPLPTLVPAGVPGHDPARCAAGCAHDVDLARRLVAEVGTFPEVVVDEGDDPTQSALARAVVDQLAGAGIPASVGDGAGGLRATALIGAYPAPEAYLHAVAGGDDGARALLDQAATVFDEAERARLLAEAEGILLGAAVAVPIAQFRTLSVASEAVQGLELGLDGTFDPAAVWLAR